MVRAVNTPEHKALKKLLAETRKRALLRQEDLDTLINRGRGCVSTYESKDKIVDVLEFIEIARACGVEPRSLFEALLERLDPGRQAGASSPGSSRPARPSSD